MPSFCIFIAYINTEGILSANEVKEKDKTGTLYNPVFMQLRVYGQ
jgi:hypothetical protein